MSAMALVATPIAAQAAPARVPAATEEGQELTTTHWVLIAIAAGLLIWGIIELTDDDDPKSP